MVARMGASRVELAPGCDVANCNSSQLDEAVAAAKGADVVVAGLGLCGSAPGGGDPSCTNAAGYYEAPGYDRQSLTLPDAQVQLVKAIAATGVPVVVFLLNGGPLDISAITPLVRGIIWAGYVTSIEMSAYERMHMYVRRASSCIGGVAIVEPVACLKKGCAPTTKPNRCRYPGSTGGKAVAAAFLGLLSPGSVMPFTTHAEPYATETSYTNMSMLAGAGRTCVVPRNTRHTRTTHTVTKHPAHQRTCSPVKCPSLERVKLTSDVRAPLMRR